MNRFLGCLIAILIASPCPVQSQSPEGAIRVYKRVGADSLVVHVFIPREVAPTGAAVALFHGGGFVWGGPEITDGSAAAYAALGLVAFSVEYRLADRKSITPLDQLADTYDAMRWIRSHASEFGVDPHRVAAHGVSAGGSLAGMAAGSPDDDARPNALILWSPGVGRVNGDDSYLRGLLLGRASASDIFPVTHMRSPMPPTIIISGQYDSVTFDGLARRYCDLFPSLQGRCEMHTYPNLGHTLTRRLDAVAQQAGRYDWDPDAMKDAQDKVIAFLRSIGYVRERP